MERKISIKNLYLVGVISLGLIGLGVGSTFAMFTASAEINDSISLTSGLEYTDDVVDLVDMTISSNKVETATLNITNNTDKTLNYTSWYKTTNNNLQIGTVVSNGYSVTGTIEPNASTQIIVSIRNRGTGVAKVTVGISASESDIVVSDGITTLPSNPLPPYLNDYITSLYTSNTKSDVTNNSITYHYASSVNLMNDRLGGTTEDLDGGNIRYYGAIPSNYIDIGDRDGNNNAILYRVIGIFDNKVKVVRNEPIGVYSYDWSHSTVNDGKGVNEWSQADIMKLLNPGYDNNKDLDSDGTIKILVNNSLWWNNQSGTCYSNTMTGSCDFTGIGLSPSIRNLIQSSIWYLGGLDKVDYYSNQLYALERGTEVWNNTKACPSVCNDTVVRTTEWTGKVALPYPSDYGYAEDFNGCDKTFNLFDDSTCMDNNWLTDSLVYRTISPMSNSPHRTVITFASDSSMSSDRIRPTFYLIENTVLESGTGTSNDPFVVD